MKNLRGSIFDKPGIDHAASLIDRGIVHANLRGQRLNNDVNALDMRGTRNQSPRRRRRLGEVVGHRRAPAVRCLVSGFHVYV